MEDDDRALCLASYWGNGKVPKKNCKSRLQRVILLHT